MASGPPENQLGRSARGRTIGDIRRQLYVGLGERAMFCAPGVTPKAQAAGQRSIGRALIGVNAPRAAPCDD
jgi:hypothetical protein